VKFFFILLILAAPPAFAHGIMGAGVWNVSESLDKESGAKGFSLEANAAVLIFNFGVSLRRWNEHVLGWNDQPVQNEAALYIGFGLLNLLQIQSGFSNMGYRTRFRSDLVLSEDFPLPGDNEKLGFWGGLTISLIFEKHSDKEVFSIGIGRAYY
jgi:hypothetical protein